MSGTATLVTTLKSNLKSRGITYKALGLKWQLSEASVKRIMSEKDLTLERIEQACELMSISFSELIKLSPFDLETTDQTISPAHEMEFSKDLRLYHFWKLLGDGLGIRQIEKKYIITSSEIQKLLLKLDHLGLIELHSNNKIKFLSGNRTRLGKDGPLGKILIREAKTNFLNHSFKNITQEHFRFVLYRLSPSSAIRYKAKIDKLINEMKIESEVESKNSDSIEFGLLAALRPWESPFRQSIKAKT
ncbi:MAG: hypothetical protein A2622_04265 [Bdellovibrionales bacterium RIFCSPHIGHO2_01_FULL_40_29]|nr:MAG: hypothetical protein A2622_04265 [Bdellovibrionales bacterium RIFCSPHIGHO2_01_FULL_40_29]OFZ34847.1 MAG: hypothetical protein A3D17_11110 [Bdellovibrionales bacterium RIFCSPHIGHO2_02_FULL_40_15]